MVRVLAVLVSDIHLSHTAPSFRSVEDSWYEAMGRQIDQLRSVAETHGVPIVCAGDVFDRWNAPPQLINWAIRRLPVMYAVPGQHDLPNHVYNNRDWSAYYTLVLANVIKEIEYGQPFMVADNLRLHAFPWGFDLMPCPEKENGVIDLAVVHRYVWVDGKSYPGADMSKNALRLTGLNGYDAAVFGDNHIGFVSSTPMGVNVINCGTFFRRRSDDLQYRPTLGLLMSDGSIGLHYMDTSDDRVLVDYTTSGGGGGGNNHGIGVMSFIDDVRAVSSDSVDFRQTVMDTLDSISASGGVRSMVMRSVDGR